MGLVALAGVTAQCVRLTRAEVVTGSVPPARRPARPPAFAALTRGPPRGRPPGEPRACGRSAAVLWTSRQHVRHEATGHARRHRDEPAVGDQVLAQLPHRVPRPDRRLAGTATPPAAAHPRWAPVAAVLAAQVAELVEPRIPTQPPARSKLTPASQDLSPQVLAARFPTTRVWSAGRRVLGGRESLPHPDVGKVRLRRPLRPNADSAHFQDSAEPCGNACSGQHFKRNSGIRCYGRARP
jgi:hypothetical protein